jgi:hypothetical protein
MEALVRIVSGLESIVRLLVPSLGNRPCSVDRGQNESLKVIEIVRCKFS